MTTSNDKANYIAYLTRAYDFEDIPQFDELQLLKHDFPNWFIKEIETYNFTHKGKKSKNKKHFYKFLLSR
jgi:hypothetical protein